MAESTDFTRDLVKRYRHQWTDRTTVQQMWDAITLFIMPWRGRFFEEQKNEATINWFQQRNIYDSTAPMGAKNLASSLHGSLTSPTIRWFDIRYRDERLNESKAATKWLQDVSERIHYELQDSNFDIEINKAYQDLVGFGTAVLTLEEKAGPKGEWNGLYFNSIPLKGAYFEEDSNGGVLRLYRLIEWRPAQIISKFGEEGTPESIRKLDEDGNTDKIDVLFCVYPRNQKILKWGEKKAPSARPWAYCYLILNTAEMCGKEGGYYEMPAFAPRWDVTNSSQWGNSPSMMALADVLTLNECVKQNLRRAAKSNDPPILAEERAVISDLNQGQGTVSIVRSIQGIATMPLGNPSNEMDTEIARLQHNIRSYYFTDTLDFPQQQPQPMTATEAQIRYERMQRYMSATLGQLRNDLLNPLIERAFKMLVRDGQLPPPPQAVVDLNASMDIEYMGALARAQQVDGVAAIERTMMSAAQFAEVFPDAVDVIDASEGVRQIGRKLNAPATLMRDKNEVALIRSNRVKQQEAMQQAQIAEQQGQAMQAQGEDEAAMDQT